MASKLKIKGNGLVHSVTASLDRPLQMKTGFLHEREFSRKTFLKGGGALIVGFGLAGAGVAGKAEAAVDPFASSGPFDPFQIDTWIAVHADNTASVKSGRIELGQGSATGLLMIVAEELNMDMRQMLHVRHDTNATPNTGETSASSSMSHTGPALRAAAATAYQALLAQASTKLGVPVSGLSVKAGVVTGGGKTTTYGELVGGRLFNVAMPPSYDLGSVGGFETPPDMGLLPGVTPAKPIANYTVVGTSPPRIDIPDKVTGVYTYIQNVRVPGMLHGRRVLPRGQSVYGFGAPVVSVDEGSIRHIPSARIVRKGDFVGVVAPKEYDAIQAAAQLKVRWADPPRALPGNASTFAGMRVQDRAGQSVALNQVDKGNVDSARWRAPRT